MGVMGGRPSIGGSCVGGWVVCPHPSTRAAAAHDVHASHWAHARDTEGEWVVSASMPAKKAHPRTQQPTAPHTTLIGRGLPKSDVRPLRHPSTHTLLLYRSPNDPPFLLVLEKEETDRAATCFLLRFASVVFSSTPAHQVPAPFLFTA